jgi:apolipoprotein N-acyltransferase
VCRLTNFLLLILSSLLFTASFYTHNLAFLAFVCLIPFFLSIRNAGLLSAIGNGFLMGFFCTFGLIHWLFSTIIDIGGGSVLTASYTLVGLASYVALFFVLFALIVRLFLNDRFSSNFVIILVPSLWVALEYLRANLFSGLPWGLIGYSQANFLHLVQLADITGVYGVSWLVVLVNIALYLAIAKHKLTIKKKLNFVCVFLFFALTIAYGDYRLKYFDGTFLQTSGGQKRIFVLQGNVSQKDKLSREGGILPYLKLTSDVLSKNVDLVVWPETTLGLISNGKVPISLQVMFLNYDTLLLAGGFGTGVVDGVKRTYSSAFLIDQNIVSSRYDKIKLLPFAEYSPSAFFDDFRSRVNGFSDLSPGSDNVVFDLKGDSFGSLICYDILFPELTRNLILNGASFLVNISNEAWFENDFERKQHFDIVKFRSIESRRYIARASNKGISGFISPTGSVLDSIDVSQPDYVVGDVIPYIGVSIYYKFGDFFALLCCFFIGLYLFSCQFIPFCRTRFLRDISD